MAGSAKGCRQSIESKLTFKDQLAGGVVLWYSIGQLLHSAELDILMILVVSLLWDLEMLLCIWVDLVTVLYAASFTKSGSRSWTSTVQSKNLIKLWTIEKIMRRIDNNFPVSLPAVCTEPVIILEKYQLTCWTWTWNASLLLCWIDTLCTAGSMYRESKCLGWLNFEWRTGPATS